MKREINKRLNEPAKVGELVLTAIIIMGFNFVGWIVILFIEYLNL